MWCRSNFVRVLHAVVILWTNYPCWNFRLSLTCCLRPWRLGLHWNTMYLVSLTEIQLVELLFWGFYSVITEKSVMNLDFIGFPIVWVLRTYYNLQYKSNTWYFENVCLYFNRYSRCLNSSFSHRLDSFRILSNLKHFLCC